MEYNQRLKQTQKEIEQEINKWCAKYANEDGTIDPIEAKKQLRGADLQNFKYSLSEWERMAKAGGYDHEMNLEYYKSRVSRLQALQAQITSIMGKQTSGDVNKLSAVLKDTYSDTYNRSIYTTQQAKGQFSANFAHIDDNTLDAIIRSGWSGANFSQRLWGNATNLLPQVLTESLFRGIALGYGNDRIVKMARVKLQDFSANQIHRLVVTETAHITEQATLKSYKESGIEKYEYLATLESHTCEVCRGLDEKTFDVEKQVTGENYPPIHPYCRCTTAPITSYDSRIDDLFDKIDNTRWARNPETGKGGFIAEIDFNTWKKSTDLLREAKNSEPKITEDLKGIISKTNSQLTGLDFRLKTLDSLARKVGNEPDAKMRDIVRYTTISTPENQVDEYSRILVSLLKKGYNISTVKNYWLNPLNPYNGINTNFFSPDGYEFELQFHTQESFDLKQGKLHELYEKVRVLDESQKEEIAKLNKEMFKLSSLLEKPKNIDEVR